LLTGRPPFVANFRCGRSRGFGQLRVCTRNDDRQTQRERNGHPRRHRTAAAGGRSGFEPAAR
jgi:hypothetical protein